MPLFNPASPFIAPAAAVVPLEARGAAGQTANLQEWSTSAGAVSPRVTPAGVLETVDQDIRAVAGGVGSVVGLTTGGLRYYQASGAQTTVGAAGAASALPLTPTKYLKIVDNAGVTFVTPLYAAS